MIHSSGFGFFLNRMHFNSSVRFLRSGEPLSRGQIIWRALSIHRGRGFRTSHPYSSRSSSFIDVHPHSSGSSVHRCSFIPFHPFITLISIHPHSSSFITFVHPRSSAFIGVHNLRIISDIAQKFLCSFPRVYLDLQCPKAKNRALTT